MPDTGHDRVVGKLQALVRIPTVSDRDPARVDTDAFDRLLAELAAQFPRLHAELELTRVGSHGLLFRWAGRSAARPVVLMAHLDVVPDRRGRPLAAPAVQRRDRRLPHRAGDLGPRHPRRQGLRGRDLRGRRAAAGGRPRARPGRLAVLRLRRGGERYGGARRRRPPAGRGGPAVVRRRRGRRDRPRGVPRREAAARRHRGHREGHHQRRAVAEGRGGHASTPARNGPTARIARAILRVEKSPFPASAPAPTLELMRRIAPARPAPPAPAALPRRPARPRRHPRARSPPARRPPR